MRALFLVLLLTSPAIALAQPDPATFPPTPICDVKTDGNGDCITDAVDQTVCLEGIVVAWKHFGDRGPGAIWDPVSGCCISVFDISNAPDIPIGTRVQVCGWVGNFAGLAEITDEPGNGSNDPVVTVIDPVVVATPATPIDGADMADDSALAEQMESCLVSVCGRFVDSGDFLPFSANYDFIADDGSTVQIRIDSDTGIQETPIRTGLVTVRGILSQFNLFQDTCIGYQLLPRSTTDFLAPQCGASIDIKPGSCPNPLNVRSKGVLPVALLGGAGTDLPEVDLSSIRLEGVAPLRYGIEDVSGPVADPAGDCDCSGAIPDGFDDLIFHFDTQEIVAMLGPVIGGDEIELTLTGSLENGSSFSASDCIRIVPIGQQAGGPIQLTAARQTQPGGPAEITYSVPAIMEVDLAVIDVTGRKIAQLVREQVSAGDHRLVWDARAVPSGVYFLRLSGDREQDVRRIVIQR